MVNCKIVISKVEIDGKVETVYGLVFYKNDEAKPFKRVDNIFNELRMAERLKELINRNNVDECHIDDIIEDSLI